MEIVGKHKHYTLILDSEDVSTWCHVTIKIRGVEHCNSLTFIEDQGGIEVDGEIVEVSQKDQEAIRKWAEARGY